MTDSCVHPLSYSFWMRRNCSQYDYTTVTIHKTYTLHVMRSALELYSVMIHLSITNHF